MMKKQKALDCMVNKITTDITIHPESWIGNRNEVVCKDYDHGSISVYRDGKYIIINGIIYYCDKLQKKSLTKAIILLSMEHLNLLGL